MRWLVIPTSLFPFSVSAQTAVETLAPLEPVSSLYLLKLTGGLVLVVAIIFLLAWLVRKFNLNQQTQSGLIKVIAGLPLGTRDRILLVQVGEEQILLGLTPGRIAKLHSLVSPVDVPGDAVEATSFASKLNRLMGEGKV